MSKVLAVYDSTGLIQNYIECPEQNIKIQPIPDGGGSMPLPAKPADYGNHARENYVAKGVLVARSPMALTISKSSFSADGTDGATITGIPAGAQATIKGVGSLLVETITDGELIITSNKAGEISVQITCRPAYQDWNGMFHAV